MLQPIIAACQGTSSNGSGYGGINYWNNAPPFTNPLIGIKTIVPTSGKLCNLHIYYDQDIVVGSSLYVTVMKNDQATPLMAEIDGGFRDVSINSRTAFNLDEQVSVAPWDVICLKITCSGAVGLNTFVHSSMVWSSSNSILNGNFYLDSTTLGRTVTPGQFPGNCTVKNFYILSLSSLTTNFTVLKNSVPTSLAVNFSNVTSGSNTVNSVSFNSGDVISVKRDGTTAALVTHIAYSMEIIPENNSECFLMAQWNSGILASNTSNIYYSCLEADTERIELGLPDIDPSVNPMPYMISPCNFKIKNMTFQSTTTAGAGKALFKTLAVYTNTLNNAAGGSKVSYLSYQNPKIEVSVSGSTTASSDFINKFTLVRDQKFMVVSSDNGNCQKSVYNGTGYFSFVIYDSKIERPMIFHDRFTGNYI